MEIYNDGKTKIEAAEAFKALLDGIRKENGRSGEINITLDVDGEKDVLAARGQDKMKNPDAVILFSCNGRPDGAEVGTFMHGPFSSMGLAMAIVNVFDSELNGGLQTLKMAIAKKEAEKIVGDMSGVKTLMDFLKKAIEYEGED